MVLEAASTLAVPTELEPIEAARLRLAVAMEGPPDLVGVSILALPPVARPAVMVVAFHSMLAVRLALVVGEEYLFTPAMRYQATLEI
jgi:hypothetical protein